MADSAATENFVSELTENQNRLFAYVHSLLGDRNRAHDVVQETNLVLWRKIDEFDPERPFLPWAMSIARYQVLASIRDQGRDRMLLNEQLVESLHSDLCSKVDNMPSMIEALQTCLAHLSDSQRGLIRSRYFHGHSVAEMASKADKTTNSMKVTLLRIRRQLQECVARRLAGES